MKDVPSSNSIVPTSSDAAAGMVSLPRDVDADFDRRWTAWKTRGVAHEHAVRLRVSVVAGVAAAIALAAAIVHGLLSS